jgi:hypothetical protein
MKVLDFPARLDPADPKVAAGLARLMDDLDLFDAIFGPADTAAAQFSATTDGTAVPIAA